LQRDLRDDGVRLAVKIGGSIAVGARGPEAEYVLRFREVINSLSLDKLAVGIGGGKLVRGYLQSVKPLVAPAKAESLAIDILRANTKLLSFVLGGRAILHEDELLSISRDDPEKIFVVGGIAPGRSTDANTAILARGIAADLFVKMTDVEGIFTADPDTDSDAELIERMDYHRALSLSVEGSPGSYGVLDRLSLQVLRDAGIPARVVNGRDPQVLSRILSGESIGTLIAP